MNKRNRFPHAPQPNDVASLFKKINQLCHSNVTSFSGALDILSKSLNNPSINPSKAIYLASKLALSDQDLAFTWVDGVINRFTTLSQNASEWFSETQSNYFLFSFNISIGTHRETQLRIIADYVLSKHIPQTRVQLIDHLKIASVIIQHLDSHPNIFPSGPVYLIQLILSRPNEFHFTIAKTLTESAARLLNALVASGGPIKEMLPELLQSINQPSKLIEIASSSLSTVIQLTQPSIDILKKLNDQSKSISNDRIIEYTTRRIYPPMIQMIEPMLTNKVVSEEKKLKQQLRKEKRKTKRDIEQARRAIQADQQERKFKRKEEKEKENRKNLAMLEGERTYDLNMAAQPAKEDDEEEEKENSENSENEDEEIKKLTKKIIRRDPDIEIDDDDESEEEDDE